jgi:hypothetical protein
MPVRVGLETVRTLLPWMVPETALIVAVPAATPLAWPAALAVAAAGLVLDQATVAVQLELVLLEYVHWATNC